MLLYCSESYTGLLLCGRPLLQIGLHNYEVFLRDRIRRDNRYVASSMSVLCLTVERVNKRVASRGFYSSAVAAGSGSTGGEADLYDSFGTAVHMTANPLLSQAADAACEGLELTAVSSALSGDEGVSRETFSMDNPMHAISRALPSSREGEGARGDSEAAQESAAPPAQFDIGSLLAAASAALLPAALRPSEPSSGRHKSSAPSTSTSTASAAASRVATAGRLRQRGVRSSFGDKVDFFENDAFIQRRVSLYATAAAASPAAADEGVDAQLLRAAEAERQARVGSGRRGVPCPPLAVAGGRTGRGVTMHS
jgi:hypothetical protein